jgi:energy-coupling factor transport system ATP-binding protein
MVRVEHLCFGFDDNIILRDITFEVKDGGLFAITGRSGTGKTTLARLLCGLLEPVSGTVEVSVQPRMVFQFPERQLFARTVLEDVMYGPLNMGMDEGKAREAALTTMRKLGLGEDLQNRSPFSLSGGEKRLAAIAGILAMDPQILVLDEPTAGLDAFGCDALVRILRALHDEGRTVIVITHDGQIMKELIPDGHLEL